MRLVAYGAEDESERKGPPHHRRGERCRVGCRHGASKGYGGRRASPPVLLAFRREALLRLLGRRAGGIFLDEGAQRLARGGALPQLTLGARDVEQRIRRLGILRPELDHFLLGGDG